MKNLKVLSIDAWNDSIDENENCWSWNSWNKIDEYSIDENGELNEDNALRFFFYSLGYRGDYLKFKTLYYINDDQYNLVLTKKENDMPLYAIEYGSSIY